MEDVFGKLKNSLYSEYEPLKVDQTIEYAFMMFNRLSNRLDRKREELHHHEIVWISAATREILNRDQMSGCIRYSENGYSFEFDDSQLSNGLRGLIVADVRVPR